MHNLKKITAPKSENTLFIQDINKIPSLKDTKFHEEPKTINQQEPITIKSIEENKDGTFNIIDTNDTKYKNCYPTSYGQQTEGDIFRKCKESIEVQFDIKQDKSTQSLENPNLIQNNTKLPNIIDFAKCRSEIRQKLQLSQSQYIEIENIILKHLTNTQHCTLCKIKSDHAPNYLSYLGF